jgi:CDP-diacylglycerol--glycerol-3-phosphate 3-phosphatidyltransferase
MKLANRITFLRIIISFIIVLILLFPFDSAGITTLKIFVNESIVVDIKYIIVGFLFIIASFTDFLDGFIARKYNCCTDFGTMMDSIADKILINSSLVLLATIGFIHPVIAVVVVIRDIVVDSIKRYVASKGLVLGSIKTAKLKTVLFMVSITMILFYNLPFELINLKIADIILVVATIISVSSMIEYFSKMDKIIKEIKN